MAVKTIKLTLEYEGTRYHGWQIQPNAVTLQQTLEECLSRIAKAPIRTVAASRTDAGVHARGQVVHFRTESRMSPQQWQRALNACLPRDMAVVRAEAVDPAFHARYSARGKVYSYTLLNRPYPSALRRNVVWFYPHPLDLHAMQEGARFLEGRHDFSAFRAASSTASHAVRQVWEVRVERHGDEIRFRLAADGFLQFMARSMVGTLVEVGRGKLAPEDVRAILESRDRGRAGPTAPAQGLCLEEVWY